MELVAKCSAFVCLSYQVHVKVCNHIPVKHILHDSKINRRKYKQRKRRPVHYLKPIFHDIQVFLKTLVQILSIMIKFPFKRKACQVYEGGCCRQVSTVVSLIVW